MQSLYEILGPTKSVEERNLRVQRLSNKYDEDLKMSIFETNYINFIKNENGLYSIIKRAIVNNLKGDDLCFYWNNHEKIQEYLEYFLNKNKYSYEIKHIPYSPNVVCVLQNVKTIDDVKELLICYYGQLQQIEHYSKSKEELWQEYSEFITTNAEWLEKKKGR